MKAIITSTGILKDLKPLSDWMPEFMIPVVNKPIVEHIIELLVRYNIKDIVMNLSHMPYETEKYFGNGEKWGAKIYYSLEKEHGDFGISLAKLKYREEGPFICFSQNVLTNLNITKLIQNHENYGNGMTMSAQNKGDKTPSTFLPFVITLKALESISNGDQIHNIGQLKKLLQKGDYSIGNYFSSFRWKEVNTINDFYEVNRHILKGDLKEIIIPGQEKKKGIWVGRHTSIHPDAKLEPPLLIGNNCNIRKGAFLGKETVLGSNVFVDRDVSIERSIIMDDSFIGSNTEINDLVIKKNIVVNVARMVTTYVKDDFILGDLNKQIIRRKGERFFNLAVALVLIILSSPFSLTLYLFHLAFPSKNYFFSEIRFGEYEIGDMKGNFKPKVFKLYGFRSKNLFLKKLPGLINVIIGDLNLVGNLPLTKLQVNSLKNEWETLRFNVPAGLFHLWEIDPREDITWQEKIIIENFYAIKRSFWGDLKILFKSLLSSRSSQK